MQKLTKKIKIKYSPQEHQVRFHNSKAYERLMVAGFGCVHPDTKIWTERGLMRISDISYPIRVLSWNQKNQKFQLSLSGGSFPKGKENLHRVVTLQGEFVSTLHHQIFSSNYKYLQVGDLTSNMAIKQVSPFLSLTNLVSDLLLSHEDVQNYSQKDVDYLGDYATLARQYGQQFLDELNDDQVLFPLHNDVLKLLQYFYQAINGFLDNLVETLLKHIHLYLYVYHKYMQNFLNLLGVHAEVSVSQILALPLEHILPYLHKFQQSLLRSESHHNIVQHSFVDHSLIDSPIVKVLGVEENVYYDMQVLETNNYIDEFGFIHHNSGKSLMGCAEILKLAFLNYGLASLIVCLNYPVARRTILPTLKQLLDSSQIDYSQNKSNFTFTIHDAGNHVIYIGSAEIPDSLKGSNVSAVYFDELAVMSQDSYYQAIARAREPKSKEIRIFSTTTPDAMNWLYQGFIKTKRNDLEVIRASTYDNAYLPDTYIKSLESRYSSELRQMFLMGEFVEVSGKVIQPKWFKYFNSEFASKHSSIIHYTCDTAYGLEDSDDTAILEWSIIDNKLWLWDYHAKNLSFPELTKFLNNLVLSHPLHKRSMLYIEPKSSGISIVQQLQSSTMINVVADKPPTESKYARVVGITGMLEAGRVMLNPMVNWDDFLFQCGQFNGSDNNKDDLVDTLVMACGKLESGSINMFDLVIPST